MENCDFCLDVHCATISEPFNHHCHPHLFFLPSKPGSTRMCSICKAYKKIHLECGECDFVLCFGCAIIPMKFMYKHDEHPLIFLYEQDESGQHWCNICEQKLNPKEGLYMCNECDTNLHINCLFGEQIYLIPGKALIFGLKGDIILNNRLTRYICKQCNQRCENRVVYQMSDKTIYCSLLCLLHCVGNR